MSPIIQWLLRVRKECGTPDKMREEAAKLTSEHARQLIIRDAAQWAAHITINSHGKHWSKP